jgi:hypothetical protein
VTTFKDFTENGQLLSTREEILNSENMSRYSIENSFERTEGYLDGLGDMVNAIDQIMYTRSNENAILNSSIYVRDQMHALLKDRRQFLTAFKSYLDTSTSDSPKP